MSQIELDIYTDGSCLVNDEKRPGGWAYTIYDVSDDAISIFHEDYGGTLMTTNNIMELYAIVRALTYLQSENIYKKTVMIKNMKIKIYTDSSWVVNCWTNSSWHCTKNKFWLGMLKLYKNLMNIEVFWVKGHASNEKNGRVDMLANREMRRIA